MRKAALILAVLGVMMCALYSCRSGLTPVETDAMAHTASEENTQHMGSGKAQQPSAAERKPELLVKVDGVVYRSTGQESTVTGRCGVMDGEITSSVARGHTPVQDDESNFGTGWSYQFGDGVIEIFLPDETDDYRWMVFEPVDVQDETCLQGMSVRPDRK